ncbi:hypothetical protein Tco_0733757 [Tanacetum coccineum]
MAICTMPFRVSRSGDSCKCNGSENGHGLRKSLVSAHDISRATIDLFNNLSHRATKLMAFLEENHKTRSQQLATFEKNFKKVTAKEAQLAIENILAI